MKPLSKQRDLQHKPGRKGQPHVEWGTFFDGCILWIRDKPSIDRSVLALSDGLGMEDWVYGHPCVVLSFFKHNVKGRIVKVAPVIPSPTPFEKLTDAFTQLTSRVHKSLGEFIPIYPVDAVNGLQLSLRNSRMLEKLSYVKKTCFELDYRMLALYSGVGADTFRLTRGSMKKLLAEMPPVIEWTPPVSSSQPSRASPKLGPVNRTLSFPEPWSRDLEAQPLLECPPSSTAACEDRDSPKEPHVMRSLRPWSFVDSTVKLVLSIPLFMLLVTALVARFIIGVMSSGPSKTYKAGINLLRALCREPLAETFDDY